MKRHTMVMNLSVKINKLRFHFCIKKKCCLWLLISDTFIMSSNNNMFPRSSSGVSVITGWQHRDACFISWFSQIIAYRISSEPDSVHEFVHDGRTDARRTIAWIRQMDVNADEADMAILCPPCKSFRISNRFEARVVVGVYPDFNAPQT
jgi:hypothetical protein